MPNLLSLANFTGLTAASGQNGLDRNVSRLYEREKLLRYSVVLSGAYVQAIRGTNVGEVLDLTKVPPNALGVSNSSWGYRGPVRMYVINPGSNGNGMVIIPGADAFHWILKIFSGVGAELAAGAYPAGLLADLDIVAEATGNNFD